MTEKIPIQENIGELSIDENFFKKADFLKNQLKNGRQKKFLDEVLKKSKAESFRYAEAVLDQLVSDQDKSYSHDIVEKFSLLGLALSSIGVNLHWPADANKRKLLIEKAALQYALEAALVYREAVQDKQMTVAKALQAADLKDVIDQQYLEDRVLKKIDALSKPIRENLLKQET